MRYLLSRLAREVRRGEIELVAFCILGTHFHLLIISLTGRLSGVMSRVGSAYTRHFNRRVGRDGPLYFSRYTSRPIVSRADIIGVVRYIDHNPVEAGIVTHPAQYQFGSAMHYSRGQAPRWLSRAKLAALAREHARRDVDDGAAYVKLFGEPTSLAAPEVDPRAGSIALSETLVPNRRRAFERQTRLADGPRTVATSLDASQIVKKLLRRRRLAPEWQVILGGRIHDGWALALAGLSRIPVGTTFREIASALALPVATVHRYARLHERALRENPLYARRVRALIASLVE